MFSDYLVLASFVLSLLMILKDYHVTVSAWIVNLFYLKTGIGKSLNKFFSCIESIFSFTS